MEQATHEVDRIQIDTSLIPESVSDEICRVVLKEVRVFFANMTPEQKADCERWKAEYRKRKSMRGGDT